MMKDEGKDYNEIKDAMNTNNMAEANFWFSEWLGAIFYYLINLGGISFDDLSKPKYRNRNVWTGWILKIMLIFGGLFLVKKIAE